MICQALDGTGIGRGGIAGTVREAGTGRPLAEVCAVAYDAQTGEFRSFALSDARGRYEIRLLPQNQSYKVRFVDCGEGTHTEAWYRDDTDFDAADPVRVRSRTTPGINIDLSLQGIEGAVTEDGTGAPLGDICVALWDPRDAFRPVNVTTTGSDGTYFVGAPYPHDDFRILFTDCRDGERVYVSEWFDGASEFATSTPVAVNHAEVVSSVDAGLAVGGTISGTVSSDVTDGALAEACVVVLDENGESIGGDLTAPDGSYSVGGLADGERFVGFEDCLFRGHGPEWWNDVPVRSELLDFAVYGGDPIGDGAEPVHVRAATETSGVDAVLSPQGIDGTVTDSATGQPIEGCGVTVWGEEVDGTQTGLGTDTAADGGYSFESLPVTDVHVEVFCPGGYLHEWYVDQPDEASADRIAIQPKTVTQRIDIEVDAGGSISGVVTDEATGRPIDACVEVRNLGEADRFGSSPLGFTCTDSDGTYLLSGLPEGDLAVSFFAEGYGTEWFDDQPDSASATPVSVTTGNESTGVDAALEVGGSIRGTLLNAATSEVAPFEYVQVFTMAGDRIGFDQAGSDGIWEIGNLRTGSYKVEVQIGNDFDHLAGGFYQGQIDLDSADPVAVIGGQQTEIVESIPGGGQVTGTITDAATGEPIVDACARVHSLSGEEVGAGVTDEGGMFRTNLIRTGEYRVEYDASCFGDPTPYANDWYDDRPDQQSADVISITEGQETTNINGTLDLTA